jgi:hypothetical protein
MMAVPIESSGQALKPGTPVQLFERRYLYSTGDQYYDVSPDGHRFVMLKQEGDGGARSIVVVQGWTQELERLVPATR